MKSTIQPILDKDSIDDSFYSFPLYITFHVSFNVKIVTTRADSYVKAGPLRLKQLTNTLYTKDKSIVWNNYILFDSL